MMERGGVASCKAGENDISREKQTDEAKLIDDRRTFRKFSAA